MGSKGAHSICETVLPLQLEESSGRCSHGANIACEAALPISYGCKCCLHESHIMPHIEQSTAQPARASQGHNFNCINVSNCFEKVCDTPGTDQSHRTRFDQLMRPAAGH